MKHLNARCEPHESLSDEQLLPWFLLGLRTSRLHDQLIVLNITSFKTRSKEAIRLGNNMREGDESTTTSIPSIVGSKDLDASSSRVSKEQSKEAKHLNIDELADLIVARLNPQVKNAAHRDNQGDAHLYPRRDMVWCSVCSRNHPSNECPRLRARPPAMWCGHCNSGETPRHPSADIQGCCHQYKLSHTNQAATISFTSSTTTNESIYSRS